MASPLAKDLCVRPGELETVPKLKVETAEESMKASRPTEQSVGPQPTEYSEMSPQRRTENFNTLKH